MENDRLSRREALRKKLESCLEKSAGRDVPRLRAAWFAVSALVLAAVACFVFAQGLDKLWGLPFVCAGAAVIVWRCIHYVRIERELRRTAEELAALLRTEQTAETPAQTAPSPEQAYPVRHLKNGRVRHRIV